MKVLVVSVAGFIASEKVAVGETETATPVAPGAGVRAVIVGGVVSPPAAAALDPRVRPVGVVGGDEPLPPLPTTSRSSLAPAMDDVDRPGRGRAGHRRRES